MEEVNPERLFDFDSISALNVKAHPGDVYYVNESPYTLGPKWDAGTDIYTLEHHSDLIIKLGVGKDERTMMLIASALDFAPRVVKSNDYAVVMKRCSGPSFKNLNQMFKPDEIRSMLMPEASERVAPETLMKEAVESLLSDVTETGLVYTSTTPIDPNDVVWDNVNRFPVIVDWKNWATPYKAFLLKMRGRTIRSQLGGENDDVNDLTILEKRADEILEMMNKVRFIKLPEYAVNLRRYVEAEMQFYFDDMVRVYMYIMHWYYQASRRKKISDLHMNRMLKYLKRCLEFDASMHDVAINVPQSRSNHFVLIVKCAYTTANNLDTNRPDDIREIKRRIGEIVGDRDSMRFVRAMLEG